MITVVLIAAPGIAFGLLGLSRGVRARLRRERKAIGKPLVQDATVIFEEWERQRRL
jgi:hypothetical protein